MPSTNPLHTGRHGGYLDPRDRVIYRLFDANDVLLYVGCTVDLDRRLSAHRSSKPWWPEVARVESEQAPGGGFSGLITEKLAIRNEKPLYNVRHNSRRTDEAGAA